MYLYKVRIYDPEKEEVVYVNEIAAVAGEMAKLKAWGGFSNPGEDPEDFDFIVTRLGAVRKKQ